MAFTIRDDRRFGHEIAEKTPDAFRNKSRYQRKSLILLTATIAWTNGDEKVFRRNWARLIQKIYEVDPLVCPKCKGSMRVISSSEDPAVIRAILAHLGIWLIQSRPAPKIHDPPEICRKSPRHR